MCKIKFYNEAFKGYEVPNKLKSCSIDICNKFNINGVCDPMYICNVIAYELETGDGCSQFNNNCINKDKIDYLVNRIHGSYLKIDKDILKSIIVNHLI